MSAKAKALTHRIAVRLGKYPAWFRNARARLAGAFVEEIVRSAVARVGAHVDGGAGTVVLHT